MTNRFRISLTVSALAGLFCLFSCGKTPTPDSGRQDQYTNTFTLDGSEYTIGSVVRFDQDNNTVQFWISQEEGLTTVESIEEAGEYLVISTHKSYLGSRDRFTKAGTFVKFGNRRFAYGDEGLGYIETSFTEEEMSIEFAVENLNTKSDDAAEETAAALKGDYKGTYATYTEEALDNEWAMNLERFDVASAHVITREDGGVDTYTLYDRSGLVAVEFTLPQSRRGLPTLFSMTESVDKAFRIKYNNGNNADMTLAFGSITAIADENGLRVSFDITENETRIRAEYEGAYTSSMVKGNRYIYSSGSSYGSGYDGKFNLTELRSEQEFGKIILKFIPEGTDEMYSDIPELTISDFSLIGQEKIDMRNTPGWYFEFDRIAVECYDNEWKPAPMAGSWLTIKEMEDGDGIIIDMELATEDPTFKYISSIDLYYEGYISK